MEGFFLLFWFFFEEFKIFFDLVIRVYFGIIRWFLGLVLVLGEGVIFIGRCFVKDSLNIFIIIFVKKVNYRINKKKVEIGF